MQWLLLALWPRNNEPMAPQIALPSKDQGFNNFFFDALKRVVYWRQNLTLLQIRLCKSFSQEVTLNKLFLYHLRVWVTLINRAATA
jgi:hypothetical protein